MWRMFDRYEHLHPEKMCHLHDAICKCCLGTGGYGCVKLYQCKEKGEDKCECNQYFVVKKIKNTKNENICKKRLRSEYTIGINVEHPNIIKTFDIDLLENILILEYCGGVDLHTYIVQDNTYNRLNTYDDYFEQLMSAIEYLHKKGIAHLDIKPENIIVKKETKILKLIDFGEAVVFRLGENCFKKKGIRGSVAYLPPEVFEDSDYECDKVDIWCCGVVLYNIIFGSMPWKTATTDDKNFEMYKRTGKLRGVGSLDAVIIFRLSTMLDCNVLKRRLQSKTLEEIEEDATPKAVYECNIKIPM
jgi:serine/threonine protein kinase